jgi:hypothetical protein
MSNPFANWSIADAELHNARVTGNRADVVLVGDAPKNERDLHSQIFDECRRRGWIALHGSMSERTHRTLGEWDFTIISDNSRVFFIELKSASGKLKREQEALIAWAKKLGHTVHIVRSFQQFIQIVS